MTFEAWLTLGVVAAVVVSLITNRASPATALVGGTCALFLFDVIDASEAFAGFSNPAPITVAALYAVAGGVAKTQALAPVLGKLLRTGEQSERTSLARLVLPAAASSTFLANTPIVAMLVPAVGRWANRTGRSASRYLIPLSYATILGGAMTVIGTSTNLVVSGLLESSGQDGLDFFELAPIAAPAAAIGLIVTVVAAPWLLPERRTPRQFDPENDRGFLTTMVVTEDGPLVGQTVAAAGLRDLSSVFLVEARREATDDEAASVIAPVTPDLVLRNGDQLSFVGRVEDVVDLVSLPGLTSAEGPHLSAVDDGSHTFYEAVVGADSPLAGSTLREVGFRARYQAAVVGIHRAGQRVDEKLGRLRLRTGDTLLILAGDDFRSSWRHGRDFLVVSRLGGPPPSASAKAPIAWLALAVLVLPPAFGVLGVLKSALLGVAVMLVGKVQTPREARDAIDINVVVMIAAAFGLSAAITNVGLADRLASVDESIGGSSTVLTVGVVILLTMMMTELLTNAAAVALMFPIAAAVAERSDLDLRTLAIGIAVAASASFLTPIGYQTNTMVYGPGGYRFTDYLRLGLPLSLIVLVSVTLGVSAAT